MKWIGVALLAGSLLVPPLFAGDFYVNLASQILIAAIFALSLKGLGPYTKLGSSLLVMSIIGGAVYPAMMGLVSDAGNIQRAFVLPLLCHAFIFYFAVRGYRPAPAVQPA